MAEDSSDSEEDEEDIQANGGAGSDSEDEDEDEEMGTDDEDEDIALSDLDSVASEDKEDIIPYQRLTINNTAALTKAYKSFALSSKLPFSENQVVVSEAPTEIEDVEDDLNRELAFYKQSLEALHRARGLLKKEGVAFSRPVDYFAEMVKDDEQMGKIKQKLIDDAAGKRASADARRQRDLKKFGKQVQVAKLQERDRTKRDTMEKINLLKRSTCSIHKFSHMTIANIHHRASRRGYWQCHRGRSFRCCARRFCCDGQEGPQRPQGEVGSRKTKPQARWSRRKVRFRRQEAFRKEQRRNFGSRCVEVQCEEDEGRQEGCCFKTRQESARSQDLIRLINIAILESFSDEKEKGKGRQARSRVVVYWLDGRVEVLYNGLPWAWRKIKMHDTPNLAHSYDIPLLDRYNDYEILCKRGAATLKDDVIQVGESIQRVI